MTRFPPDWTGASTMATEDLLSTVIEPLLSLCSAPRYMYTYKRPWGCSAGGTRFSCLNEFLGTSGLRDEFQNRLDHPYDTNSFIAPSFGVVCEACRLRPSTSKPGDGGLHTSVGVD